MGWCVQEPEELEPGAGAGMQDVTELDAWQKCGALSAVGMSVQEVLPHDRDDSLYIGQTAQWSADCCWHICLLHENS